MEVPQFSQVLPPLPDTPRGISETPMVRVPATASLLRPFQPRSSDSFHSVYNGLRPIYAKQSHPKTLNPAHIQSLRDAKLRSGSGSPNDRSLYFLEACCSTKFFEEPSFGVLENRIFEIFSQTPRLPIAKATIKVILIYIPVRSAGGGLHGYNHSTLQLHSPTPTLCSNLPFGVCRY